MSALMMKQGLKIAKTFAEKNKGKDGLLGKLSGFGGKLNQILGSDDKSLDATPTNDVEATPGDSPELRGKRQREREAAEAAAAAEAAKKKQTTTMLIVAAIAVVFLMMKKK
jgi:hypothetical protein